jgi:hypothetical protein
MKTRIYQICYSAETLNNIEEGFVLLDNINNERPDWREYWPIRNFLLNNYLSDDTLYGFLSPKFSTKSTLNYIAIQNFLKDNYGNEDVVSFSPFWDLMSIFKNVFEQGDFFHPGLTDACQYFADLHLAGLDLRNSITHSQNTIFCNYFLATRKFWLQWLEIGELLFNCSEKNTSELSKLLNATTTYGEQRLPMKVFIQERLATICLLKNKEFKCLNYNSFAIGASTTPFNKYFHESVTSDALKLAYDKSHEPIYLHEFSLIREKIIQSFLQNTGQ